MRKPIAASGLLPVGAAFTAMITIFSRPLPSWTLGDKTKKRTSRANFSQLPPPSWKKVLETKSRHTRVFGHVGCTGRLRACQFLGEWRAMHVSLAIITTAEIGYNLVYLSKSGIHGGEMLCRDITNHIYRRCLFKLFKEKSERI